MSPSPNNTLPPRFQNRHGHSLSLAPASHYNPTGAFNPFGPSATLGSDQIFARHSPGLTSFSNAIAADGAIHAPQGRVPTNVSSLAPPQPLSRPESRPDFARGFGLDNTEEEEEPTEDVQAEEDSLHLTEATEESGQEDLDGATTVGQSRAHSRHVSKLSAPLSLRSVGGADDSINPGVPSVTHIVAAREPVGEVEIDDMDGDGDAVEEWTGSEDLRDTSDDEVGFLYVRERWQLLICIAEHRRVVESFR